jgi:hypothetical protein
MPDRITLSTLLVPDCEVAPEFFLRIGFIFREDTDLGDG